MGNASSDSLDHSFKRLRLSQTEHMPLPSPISTSPKRKVPLAINAELQYILNNNTANDTSNQSPILLCQNNDLSSSRFDIFSQISTPNSNNQSDEDFSSDEELISLMKSRIRSLDLNHKTIHADELSMDKKKAMDLSITIPELSDDDLMECVKRAAYINKQK